MISYEAQAGYSPLTTSLRRLLAKKEPVHVAIEGMSNAGKSSLAAFLASLFHCNVIPIDHFFLPQALKTPARLAQPGGNVHYERIREEVLAPLATGPPFKYQPFDCKRQELANPVIIHPRPLTVVEGVYSLHPELAFPYQLRVFLKVAPREQNRRCLKRNPQLCQRYLEEWIPLENTYFRQCNPQGTCDFVFTT